MPLECLDCLHLDGQSLRFGSPFICQLTGKCVDVTRDRCDLPDFAEKIMSLLPIQKLRVIVMSKEGVLEFDLDNLNLDDIPLMSDFIVDSKKWQCTHKDVLDETIVVISFTPITTSYGDAKLADIVLNGERKTCLMGGTVLVKQLDEVEEKLPLKAKIVKEGRYYQFVAP